MPEESLYVRLGGYDAIAAVAKHLHPRLVNDQTIGRFWANSSPEAIKQEGELLIQFLCHSAGGPMEYTGRDMKLTHQGMGISAEDWKIFRGLLEDTLKHFQLPDHEFHDVIEFIDSTYPEIVEK